MHLSLPPQWPCARLRGDDLVELRDEGAEEGHGSEENEDAEDLGGGIKNSGSRVNQPIEQG